MSNFALVGTTDLIIDFPPASYPVPSPYQVVSCPAGCNQSQWSWNVSSSTIVNSPPTSVTQSVNWVLKSTIRTRMASAGLSTAYQSAITAMSAYNQNLFADSIGFKSTDSFITSLITTAGGTLSSILAPDASASRFFGDIF